MQQKQKPEHSNLIYPTTTTRTTTKKHRNSKPTNRKANTRVLKANAKNLKNLQKNSVF